MNIYFISLQVPMGVNLHDENKLNEMSEIMKHYMKYVHPITNEPFDATKFYPLLFGGDYLTVVRMRSTKALRETEYYGQDRFEGLVPVVEDWHTRMVLMQVYIQQLYIV